MKERTLQILLVVALVAAAFALRGREPRVPETPEGPQAPEETVNAFFDAASRGDDAAYLALVGGEVERSLRTARSEVGAEAFRSDLRRSAAGIKGLALTRRDDAPPGLVALDVEIVFTDRNERQRMLLAPRGGGWVITAIGAAETTKPSIPYGTPVFEE